ncbi:MAG: Xaa-Pro peptidase family protein [Myxococcales bacterium]|nr:Xaa-Pro peptidase family protein [Myxococcales bacterium]MDH5567664.1 Xaa-Pro peptidase family protein [Myxococcales bacterium]
MSKNRATVLEHCHPALEVPFGREEYRARLTRIRERMASDGIDLLYLTSPESLFYVSGYTCEWYQTESPVSWPPTSGIAVHVDHDKYVLFDTPSEQVMVRFVTLADDVRIFPLEKRRDGIAFIVDELRAEGWLQGRVGLELHSHRPNPAVSQRFRQAFEAAGCQVIDGSAVLRELRWVKSPQEMAYLEQAGRIGDIGLAAARDAIRPGVTELEVYGEVICAMAKAGGENPGITLPVLSGPKANTGHALAGRRSIQAGEQVNVDVCGVYNRYHCNAARSFYVGEPPRDVVEFYDKAAGAMELVGSLIRPNLRVGELVKALKAYYEEQGIWEEASWLGGYELGIAFPPDWVGNFVYEMSHEDSDVLLEPGTAVNFESVFFGPRMSGLTYLIDTLLFKQDAAELASRMPRGLTVLEA